MPRKTPRSGKYNAKRTNGYASKREANRAAELHLLLKAGKIANLNEQFRICIAPEKDGVRGVFYVADFCYFDSDGFVHVEDVKGYRTKEYLLKKKLLFLLHGIRIEEV